ATWTTFRLNPAGNEPQVKTVLPTSIDLDPGAGVQEMILVGTLGGDGGLYRSDDDGQTYTRLAIVAGSPSADVTQLIVDPNDSNTFYAGVAGQGVFRGQFSAGTGIVTWTALNTGLAGFGVSADIQLAAHDAGATTVLFALVCGSSRGAFRLDTAGGNTTWTALAQPPTIFSDDAVDWSGNFLVADPVNSQIAYATGYSSGDHVYRYDPSGAGSWIAIMGGGGGPTRPHPDGRGLAFMDSNTLVEVNDGGIYFLPNPSTATPAINNWQSFNGNTSNGLGIGAVEFHNVAWDGFFNVIAGGSQDNGTEVQQSAGNLIWTVINGGDGGDVTIDDVTLAGAGRSIRYVSSQNMGGFRRIVFDSATNIVQNVPILPGGGLTDFNGTFVPHFEVNTIDPAAGDSKSLVVGGGGTSPVYEATMPTVVNSNADVTWTAVPVAGGFGTVNTLAYGGRRNGADDPDILYAGTENGVYLRTTAGGTLNATATAFPGGAVSDISLDPDDWQHAFVISATGVWETTDAGATAWTPRTGNLVNPNLRTVEYADVDDVDAVLVGGLGGVFRMITNSPGLWSEYGQFLPNTAVYDLDYDFNDNVVVVGTLGRGAWKVENARDTLTVTGVLQITGDTDFPGQDDVIELVRDPNIPTLLLVILNGTEFGPYQIDTIEQINVDALGGNDTLIVDSSNGLINVPLGIRYNAGIGFDDLWLEQTGGDTQTDEALVVGARPRSGQSVITGPGGTQTVFFERTEPIVSIVPAVTLSVTSIPGLASLLQRDNAINYSASQIIASGGRVTVDNFEPIEFINKQNLVIDAGAGSDTIHLNNPSTPTGLTSITVNGDDPTASDTLIVNGVAGTVLVHTGSLTITGVTGLAGAVPVNYGTIEELVVSAGSSSRLTVRGSADYTVNPGAAVDEGTVLTAWIPISFVGFGPGATIELAGTDDLVVNGTEAPDAFAVAATSGDVTPAGRATIERSGSLTDLYLNGLGGDDTFDVTGSQPYTTINISGGDPSASDVANLTGNGSAAVSASVGDNDPVVTGGGLGTVNLSGVEIVNLDASGEDLTVSATASADAVWVTPLGANSGALQANGVAPVVNFSDVATFSVDLLAGSDTLTVNGSAGADEITVSGSAVAITGKEAVNYSNTEALTVNGLEGSDSFDVTPAAIPIFIDGGDPIASLPGDLLTIQSGGDPVTINPGPENDEGSFDVGANEPVSFDRVESFSIVGGGPLVVNGTNGPDAITLIARDDSTHAGADGVQDFTVSINGSSDFLFLDVPQVTVNALSGSDEIVLRTPAPNDAAWGTDVTIHGGPPSASDRVVVETPGADPETVVYTPTGADAGSIDIDGDLVTLTGVEELVYDGEGDDDSLTVVGTSGDDVIVHTPGVADDAGSFAVNTL
ncbi:hypothetical protein LCGC14_1418530, partial [marine sediment metagenome]